MNQKEIYNLLLEINEQKNIFINEPMSKHTSFKIGGCAAFFVRPDTKQSVADTVKLLIQNKINYYIMGNGTNLLVSDSGFDGVILQIYDNLSGVKSDGECIFAEAGVLLSSLANTALKNSLTGFEFASGIPGTVGGAVTMNAGAYDGDIKSIIQYIECLDRQGNILELNKRNLKLGYRTSIIQHDNLIVLSACFKGIKGDQNLIKEKMTDLNSRRREKQPLNMPSAGSTFKRPEGYYAGKLIQDSGLTGYTIGGAQVSDKHCGFIVNKGNASCEDILNLIQYVKTKVHEKYDVFLETEVKYIGG